MKKYLFCFMILLFFSLMSVGAVQAGVNDFYFSDFTGDYYLTKDDEGISHLKVVEQVTAVFPDHNQNKGICRQIPFTNQNGTNLTLPSLNRSNIKVLRNGINEPIYSIDKEDGYYNVCTGDDSYVLGEQVYIFEYEFEKVISVFDDYQELYWDANGNGATQRFDKVTARVHLEDGLLDDYTGRSWCYVGKYGENGQSRCNITEISDGVQFSTSNLSSFETLTFDMEFKPESFVIPEPGLNYAYVWITVVLGVACFLSVIVALVMFIKSRSKARFYKKIFVKPEYQPNDKYGLTEMAELYIGKKKDIKVSMLLDLVVKKKIEFQRVNNRKWSIIVKNLDGVLEEYKDLLGILNGGVKPSVGDVVELKSRTATNQLRTMKKSMESQILSDLKRDKLVEKKYQIGESGKWGVVNTIATIIVASFVFVMMLAIFLGILDDMFKFSKAYNGKLVFEEGFYLTVLVMIVVTVMVVVALYNASQKYIKHTKLGLKMSRYMDGLKLYIKMAEADRMKMLQSVKGADISPEGIVKLYEKLLPYAAVFGLEESWMNEMKEYCKIKEVEEPDYLLRGMATSEISRNLRDAASYATTATTMTSSGGGLSSGNSGGGGGGFSGGGGGGGGFGGR